MTAHGERRAGRLRGLCDRLGRGAVRRAGACLVAALVGGAGVLAPTAAHAATEELRMDPLAGTIYAVTLGPDGRDTAHRALGYAEWLALGAPAAAPLPVDVVRYPWSSSLYGVVRWATGETAWTRLGWSQWASLGTPAPRDVAWVPGTTLHRWATGDEVFATSDGTVHALSHAEWTAMGSPRAELRANRGFVRLTWDSTILAMKDLERGQGTKVGYAEWLAAGAPTPQASPRLPGDAIAKDPSGPTVYYFGPSLERAISFSEWRAAGAPAPYGGRNGQLDVSTLCGIAWDAAERLRCDAADALARFNAAYRARWGTDIVVGDSYRTYWRQVQLRLQLGRTAALPGTSNQGWGTAVDIPEAVGRAFGTQRYDWVVANGPAFGWVAPSWARLGGSNPEYWHFEYVG
ncbi:M15 family metallopeptidase [Cellulomonas endophytica]|uniref:M15 family metallopeptidase n=1 Tax=Cellulomonas endophytica TaxID=2494735 RepID=UPI001011801E|nr:M15 family metallopeptidase [Cellulomonas endophytica]